MKTEAVISIAEDRDVLVTIEKPNGMLYEKQTIVTMKDNFLKIGQEKKCYINVDISDKSTIEALQYAIKNSKIMVIQVDDDGFDVFENILTR